MNAKEKFQKRLEDKSILLQYLRNKKGNIRGVIVAVKEDGDVVFGHALHNPRDRFDKYLGIEIAVGRAIRWNEGRVSIPSELSPELEMAYARLSDRANRYWNKTAVAV